MPRSLILLTALLAACATNGARPEAKSPPPKARATIVSDVVDGDVREVKLSNGLQVLLKESHAAPVATFVVYYKVGSRNETTGHTGSSHLLEHLLFKGSEGYPGRESIWGGLSRIGASFNATTYYDRTNYYATVPVEQLPFVISLEADRMRRATFTDADRQSEMTVVRNELERGENDPGRVLHHLVWAQSIIAHPYHHPVIGWRSDVENVPTSQLRSYYDTWYHPDNAVVAVVGAFDSQVVLDQIVRDFGVHPGGNEFPPMYTTEEPQRGERRVTVKKPGELAIVELGWKLPPAKHDDVVPLKVLQLVLAGTLEINEFGDPLPAGISNRLYQALVETQLSTGASMDYTLMVDPVVATIRAWVRPGVEHQQVEDAIRAEIRKLQETPVGADELQRAKDRARAAFGLSQDGTFGQAMALGYFGLIDDWRFVRGFSDRVEQVTAEDVQRVAREWFPDDGVTVGWFVPQRAENAPQSSLDRGFATLIDQDDFAMAQQVEARALAGGASVTQPKVKTFPNGLRVVVQENPATSTFAISGAVLAGSVHETPSELALSSLTADMLERGTTKQDKLAIARKLESVGASLGFGGGFEWVSIGGQALSEHLPMVLDVLSEQLLTPAFDPAELEKLKAHRVAGLRQAEDSTRTRGYRALMQGLYPPGHPLHYDDLDTSVKAVERATVDTVRGWWQRFYGPDRTVLTVVGNVDAEEVFRQVESKLGAWQPVKGPPVSAPLVPLRQEAGRVDVFIPSKSNIDLFLGQQGDVRRTDPDWYAVMMANRILGGGVSGRLFKRVRNDEGLTYGIGSSLSTGMVAGPWTVSLTVNPQSVDKALAVTREVLDNWHANGVTKDELDDAKTSLSGLYQVGLGTNGGLASVLTQYEVLGLGAAFVNEHTARLQAVTLDEVNAAVKKHFAPDRMLTVAAGTLVKP